MIPKLKIGDTVDIIAPAAGCHPETAKKLEIFLQNWGLHAHIPTDMFGEDLLCANSDDKRLEHLTNAITNKQSKAIWCLRGGYGTTRLIPELTKLKPLEQTKTFVGFSDITALHIFFQDKWNWKTIHGPSGQQAALQTVANESLNLLKEILFQQTALHYPLKPLNSLAQRQSQIDAAITGGNLCLIEASLGTSWQINAANKILFMEETNERGYKIDRSLEHLKQAHVFQNTKAIIMGDFTGGKETNGISLVMPTVKRFAEQCSIPVFQLENVGHGDANHPLPLGYLAVIKTDGVSNLSLEI